MIKRAHQVVKMEKKSIRIRKIIKIWDIRINYAGLVL